MTDTTHQYLQGIDLLIKALVLFGFGISIIAYQLSKERRPFHWPIPGAYIGAAFLIVDSLQPFHMAAQRFGLLSWPVYSIPTSALYTFIALNSVAAFWRWLRQGFDDTPGPWEGRPNPRSLPSNTD